ncbi:MAG: hypothetical protein KIT11_09915 [Fimbriimonadaceae bacterium]|nr:hypothetical protein [Fimbriimonadaceae bacterium]QYK55640.1 MAG: hypothetical protein KF733_11585 [Fimbriimonadaceae bacterium]
MADTTAQSAVANWVRDTFLPAKLDLKFVHRRVRLRSGGTYHFSFVSEDGKVVGSVITSRARTASGKLGNEKMNKYRADLYFLLIAEAEQRLMVLTDPEMYELLCAEKALRGRIPQEIELLFAPLPKHLANRLAKSQKQAADEVFEE